MTIDHATWHKSSYSNGSGGACVEVADLPGARAVRDSKNPTGPALRINAAEWSAFTAGLRTGRFD
ncbi:MAG TPA: DUF397 domain-containing protein [Pseudonocardiaceae bacterium]|jgi:hypothetical protein